MHVKATCDWCNTFVKAPKEYNPLQHAIFCCQHCREKNWLFNRWMSDERLTEIAERARDEQKNADK